MTARVARILSGGQTGVDRAALDAAIDAGVAYGGWCPRGGWAEDLPEPPGLLARYPGLRETESSDPVVRTERNVIESDATLVIRGRGVRSPGTDLTERLAAAYGKPLLGIEDVEAIEAWLDGLGGGVVLNVAGPRASEDAAAYDAARAVVGGLLRRSPAAEV